MTEAPGSMAHEILEMSRSFLRGLVGRRLTQVSYRGLTEAIVEPGIHDVDQTVIVSTDSAQLVLEWRID